MSDLINTNSQLSVFDYQGVATKYGDSVATELKGLEYQGTGILTNARIELGNVLLKAKELIDYRDFQKWYNGVWGITSQRASDFMKVAEANKMFPESGNIIPDNLRSASTMAKAILGVSDDKREELVEEFKEKTQEKGKSLTEKEIKELAKKYLDEKDKQIKELEQKEIDLTAQLAVQQTEKDKLKGQVDYFNRVWKHQNEKMTKLMNENKEWKEKQEALVKQEKDLEEDKAKLEETIKKQAEEKASKLAITKTEEQVKQEKEAIENEKKRLKAIEDKLNKEKQANDKKEKELKDKLSQAKKELAKAEELKRKIDGFHTWMDGLKNFNTKLENYKNVLLGTAKHLVNFDIDDAVELIENEAVKLEIEDTVNKFNANSQALTDAINEIKVNMDRLTIGNAIAEATTVNIKVVELVD